MSTSRVSVVSKIPRTSCPNNCGDIASAHSYFSDTIISVVDNVDITRSIYSNAKRISELSASRGSTISTVPRSSCPSNGSDYASAHCYFSNTVIVTVGNVDIALSIDVQSMNLRYFSTSRSSIISTVVTNISCSCNCHDELFQSVC